MATTPTTSGRATIQADGTKFDAISTSVTFNSLKDHTGQPVMGSLTTDIKVYVDIQDDGNVPFGTLQTLFNKANKPSKDKLTQFKITFWKDEEKQNAICTYTFNGWISSFTTANPLPVSVPGSNGTDTSPYSTVNHLLVLDLVPVLNTANSSSVVLGN